MKKILFAVVMLCIAAAPGFAQKTLSTPGKTETTSGSTTTTSTTTPNSNVSKQTESKSVTPPPVVLAKFKSMYPNNTGVKWIQNKEGNYVAIYKVNEKAARTVYTADGSVKRIVTPITQKELPTAVSDFIAKNQPGKTPKNCMKIQNGSGNITYSIKFEDKLYHLDSKGVEIAPKDDNNDDVIDSNEEKSMK
ncbi:MAG TPA: hypothetical protein DCQ93_08405 [Bacteroidetes bacterium]|nr:hypothetical protein [Bacteroidota bacterium]